MSARFDPYLTISTWRVSLLFQYWPLEIMKPSTRTSAVVPTIGVGRASGRS